MLPKVGVIPLTERTVRLPQQPFPSELDAQGPDASISAATDPLLVHVLVTAIGRRREPDAGADLSPIRELAPRKQFRTQGQRTVWANPTQACEVLDLGGHGVGGVLHPSATRLQQLTTPRLHVLVVRPLAGESGHQRGGQRMAVPDADECQMLEEVSCESNADALCRQQARQPRPDAIPIGLAGLPFPLQLTIRFGVH